MLNRRWCLEWPAFVFSLLVLRLAGLARCTSRAKACALRPQRLGSAVGAVRRLPCDARGRDPSPNSRRSLRSLCSNMATNQLTKRAARAATATALLGASQGALRPERTRLGRKGVDSLPVESQVISCCGRRCPVGAIFRGGCVRPSGAGRAGARFVTCSRPLSERRERSERREFGRAGPRRADTAKSAQPTTPDEPPPGSACRSPRGATPVNSPAALWRTQTLRNAGPG